LFTIYVKQYNPLFFNTLEEIGLFLYIFCKKMTVKIGVFERKRLIFYLKHLLPMCLGFAIFSPDEEN